MSNIDVGFYLHKKSKSRPPLHTNNHPCRCHPKMTIEPDDFPDIAPPHMVCLFGQKTAFYLLYRRQNPQRSLFQHLPFRPPKDRPLAQPAKSVWSNKSSNGSSTLPHGGPLPCTRYLAPRPNRPSQATAGAGLALCFHPTPRMEKCGLAVCGDQNGAAHSTSSRWNTNVAYSMSGLGR